MVKVPATVRQETKRPVLPDGSSVLIRETGDGLGIYNPARRKPYLLLFLTVWLFMWSMGFRFGVQLLFDGGVPGIIASVIWLPIWGMIGIGVSIVLGWYAFGWERLFITEGVFVHARGIGPARRMKAYAASEVSKVHVDSRTGTSAEGMPVSAIKYDVRSMTRRFGIEMSRQEAEAAVAAMKRHLGNGEF
jgi:hypothetical protein